MSIKAIVFDLGGTLIEYAGPYATWPDLETPGFQAAYDYLGEQGVNLPPFATFRQAGFDLLPERWQRAVSGTQNLRLVDMLKETLLAAQDGQLANDALMETAARRYETAVCKQATMIAGAPELLTTLKEKGYKLGLLSNTMFKGRAHQNDLQRFGLDHYFDTMLFSAEVNKWKPTAAPFLHVLEALGVEGETAVYIGDDPSSDVVGGQRAGMKTVHFASSQRFHKPIPVQPHATISQLADFLPLLNEWTNQ